MNPKGKTKERPYSVSKPALRKRLKIPIACAPCRSRKVKCDGARPACQNCQRRQTQTKCVYNKRPDQLSTALEGVDAEATGEERSSPLSRNPGEGMTRDSDRPNPPLEFFAHDWPPIATHSVGISDSEFPVPFVSAPGNISSCGVGRDTGATDPLRSLSSRHQAEPEGTDSMNGVTGDPTRTPEVFGSSSAGSFMREIQSAINARLGASHTNMAEKKAAGSSQPSRGLNPQLSSSVYEEPALFLLPPRSLADSLMRAYWDNDWSLYPVINRGEIEATYESLWTSQNTCTYPLISISVINLCFAIGCYYCELVPPRERKTTSDDFFARAELVYKKTGDVLSYERVQCLLLFGIYLQSTSVVSKCWMTVGEAIRMAQSLGIHLAHHERSQETASHREYQRRIWHGCVWLDRVLSSTLGRPGMIPNWLFNSIPLPSMIDDEFFETQVIGSPFRPDGRPCTMVCVVKAMELYQILDEILVALYLKTSKDEDIETRLMHILQIDAKLVAWNKSLPDFLLAQNVAEHDGIVSRQAIVLRARFLHARILLLRPTVINYCTRSSAATTAPTACSFTEDEPHDSYDNSSLSEVMLAQCARMSFRTAHELIETFDRFLDRKTLLGPLPNWWYSVLYVYNATMMILVERFIEGKNGSSTVESKAERAWNIALGILKSYGVLADSATRCVAVLEIFLEKLLRRSHENGSGSNDYRDNTAISTTQQALGGYDWDALWAMSSTFGQETAFSDLDSFPFNSDDFTLSDML